MTLDVGMPSYPDALVVGFPPPFEDVRTLHDAWGIHDAEVRDTAVSRGPTIRREDENVREFSTFEDVGSRAGAFEWGVCGARDRARGVRGIVFDQHAGVGGARGGGDATGATSVPLYDTLGPDAVVYIANHAALTCVACSEAVLGTMVGCLRETPTVKLIISYGGRGRGSTNRERGARSQGAVTSERAVGDVRGVFGDRCEESDAGDAGWTGRFSDDLLHVGDDGRAEGRDADAQKFDLQRRRLRVRFGTLTVGLSHFLSSFGAHLRARDDARVFVQRRTRRVYRGDVLALLDDIAELKPTVFCSVPRLWNRIYDKVNAGVREGSVVAQKLFHWAYESKKHALMKGKAPNPFFEKLVVRQTPRQARR